MTLGWSGYGLLFGMTLIEQLGLPLPAAPLLIAAGAMAGAGRLSFAAAFASAALGSLIGDLTWYRIGMTYGRRALGLLSRTAASPEACGLKAEEKFAKNGKLALVVGRFVPGVSTLIRPMAAVAGVRPAAFLAYDAAGMALQVGGFMLLGSAFRGSTQGLLLSVERTGGSVLAAGLAAIGAYLLYKMKSVSLVPTGN